MPLPRTPQGNKGPALSLSLSFSVKRDDIVVVEVMAQSLDRAFWADYRRELEELFHQDEIIIRAQTYEAL